MAEALSHCAAAVRRVDYDRFLTALFAPPAAREGLFALYAFNHEVAKVRETVSEPMLGQVRLQWWRAAVDGAYAGSAEKHPVAEALAALLARSPGVSRAHFGRLIDAREFDLAGRAPESLAELEKYCEGTSSALLWLAAEHLGARGEATHEQLRHVGIAWALVGLIRAIPFHARARRRYVPADIAAAAGLAEEALFALTPGAALARAVARLAAAAERHLAEARMAAAEPAARPLLLFAALARAYLRALDRRGHDVMGRPIEISPVRKIARLWWATRTATD